MNNKSNEPALRFPEFKDKWEFKKAKEIFSNRRVKSKNALPIYSVTMDRGLIPRDSLEKKIQQDAATEDNLIAFPNDIVYNMMRMWQGALGIAYQNCMISPAYVILKPREGINSEFYALLMKTKKYLYKLESYSHGLTSDRLRLYYKDFSLIEFPVPSLNEQIKISNISKNLDLKVEMLSKKKDLLGNYKKGVMKQLFSRKIRFKDGENNEYEAWKEILLGDICEIAKSGGTPSSTRKDYYDGDIPFLSISDMTSQGKYLNYASNKISLAGLNNSSSWIVPENSIIYSMYASVGFVAINKIPIATSQAVLNLVLKKGVNLEFVYYKLMDLQESIAKFINTGTQGNLNAHSVKNFKIHLPCIEEQNKIASYLSVLDEKISQIERYIEITKTYKKGLLQKLLV